MNAPNWAQRERAELCDLLLDVGPEAPTLCGGWLTRDLAAHLVIREGRPDASPGIFIGQLSSWTRRVHDGLIRLPWPELVAVLREGPPWWSPFRLPGADRLGNTAEFFVHHEDVRRARPEWTPRELDPGFADALWLLARRLGPVQYRGHRGGVVLARTDGADGRRRVSRGTPEIVVSGPASELVLYGFGRRSVALVEISEPGDPRD
ncbi:MAG: TIGR03085 family metal-binding protein [Candidatus Nanopelagicales bacterium]|nr:TIGR03085 family metal-binding protein [Candidatus Nanopelagicales bacterium]